MMEDGKCRPQCCNTRGGDGTGPASQARDRLQDEYSIFLDYWQEGKISCLLSAGQENAVPLRHLKTMLTGWSGRGIRREIERERRSGIPILSGSTCGTGGYFLPANRSELDEFVNSMYGRSMEIAKTAAAVLMAVEKRNNG